MGFSESSFGDTEDEDFEQFEQPESTSSVVQTDVGSHREQGIQPTTTANNMAVSQDVLPQTENLATTTATTKVTLNLPPQTESPVDTTMSVSTPESLVKGTTSKVEVEAVKEGVVKKVREIVEDTKTVLRMSICGIPRHVKEEGVEFFRDFIRYPTHYGYRGKLDSSVARYIIRQGGSSQVSTFLGHFENLDKNIGFKLIEEGKDLSLIINDKGVFNDLTEQEIIGHSLKSGRIKDAVNVSFSLGSKESVSLEKDVARQYIELGGNIRNLVSNKEVFNDLGEGEIIEHSLKNGRVGDIAENLDVFSELDNTLARELLIGGQGDALVKSVSRFRGLDDGVAQYFLSNGLTEEFSFALGSFEGLDKGTGLKLIETGGDIASIVLHKEVFNDFTIEEIIDHSLKSGRVKDIVESVITLSPEEFVGFGKDVAIQYIEETDGKNISFLLNHIEAFNGLKVEEIVDYSLNSGRVKQLVYAIATLSSKELLGLNKDIAIQFIETGGNMFLLLHSKEAFNDLPIEEIVECASKSGRVKEIVESIIKESPEEFVTFNKDVAKQFIEAGGDIPLLLHNMEIFDDLAMEDIVDYSLESRRVKDLVTAVSALPSKELLGLNKDIAVQFIEAGGDISLLVHSKEAFNNLTIEEIVGYSLESKRTGDLGKPLCEIYGIDRKKAKELLFIGGESAIVNRLYLFDEWTNRTLFAHFDKEIVQQVIPNNFNLVHHLKPLHTYGFSDEEEKNLYNYFASTTDLSNIANVSNLLELSAKMKDNNLPVNVAWSKDIFGESLSVNSFIIVNDLLAGREPSEELRILGIDKTGQEGVDMLSKVAKNLLNSFNTAEIHQEELIILKQSRLAREMLANISDFGGGRWNSYNDSVLLKKINSVYDTYKSGILSSLPEGYEPSGVYEIWKLSANKEGAFTEDVIGRYSVLQNDVSKALEAVRKEGGMRQLVENVRLGIEGIYAEIENQIASIDRNNPKADFIKNNLEKKKEHLSAYLDVSVPMSVYQGLDVLGSFNELESPLRQLVFGEILRRYPERVRDMSSLVGVPSVENLSRLIEFIDYIVGEDTYTEHFSTNKSSVQIFQKIANTKSLNIGLKKALDESAREGKTRLQIIPTRGLLLEISGDIAGTCWNKCNAINEKMPNMSALIIRARPGEKTERIVGAALLIETFSPETGEKVLVLRGTNPTENYINTVEASGFYDVITDYVRETAKKRGMIPAVVIDEVTTGASTNRSVLRSEMLLRKAEMTRIEVDNTTTYFNGRRITEHTYRLDR